MTLSRRDCLQALATAAVLAAAVAPAHAQPAAATFAAKAMTPESALAGATAAMEHCRRQGWQVAVAVVDRGGLVQALLRDRHAGAHTLDAATDKAWTSASFRIPTAALAAETQAGKPMSGLRALPRVMAAGGGLPIEAGGTLLGGIGVSGAPGGEADDTCAKAGIDKIADALELD